MKLLPIFLVVCYSCDFVSPAKILGVFPASAHSHFTLGFQLMKELAVRGNEVVFINSHPQKEPIKNFRDVSTEVIKKTIAQSKSGLVKFIDHSYIDKLNDFLNKSVLLTKSTFTTKPVQDLLNSNEHFDLVIMEMFMNQAMVYFAHRFRCPLILLAPGPTMMFNNHMFANPAPPSYVSNLWNGYGSKMDFWQRLENTYKELVAQLHMQFRTIPEHNKILKEVFPDAPDLRTILYNASLLLTASHVSMAYPVPHQQNIKEIGPYFMLPPKPLPEDIQMFMDNSTEGVVIFSMGSNLKSNHLDSEKRKIILKSFSKIKQKVLWKFEEDFSEKSDNVKIVKWIPQADVLAHPNTVAFISHGGLLGITEAVYNGVPILGLPVFGDQNWNIHSLVEKGLAIKVDFNNMKSDFEKDLIELLNNPRYKKAAVRVSSIMRDNPQKPMDAAIYWIEYVLRHNGAPHLRSAAMDLKWYQLYLLDIILFVGFIIIFIFTILYFILRCICTRKIIVEKYKKIN